MHQWGLPVHMRSFSAGIAICLFAAAPTFAQEAATSPPPAGDADHDLAKQVANPVANLISVPLQNNVDCCYGPDEGLRYTLNVQPVIPVPLGKDWRIITRTIVPFVYQESTAPGVRSATGFGDITQSFFLSPTSHKNGVTWALGPAFLWPIGESAIGGEKWGAGPTGILLKQSPSGLTFGMLANHIWSYAGDDQREDISNTLIQPFISQTFRDTTSVSLNTETTYDWKHDVWTVPINISVGHIFKFGRQPVQISAGAKIYAEGPDDGPHWGTRLTISFLFPE